MKKNAPELNSSPILLVLSMLAMLFAFASPKFSLIGRWSILNLDGRPSGEYLDFKKDNTYSISLPNGQVGENGEYRLRDTVFSIKNNKNMCGKDYWGKYSLVFHGNDSVHFALIADTCTERKMDIVGFNPGLKRYKAK
jgi:hypothetical protein